MCLPAELRNRIWEEVLGGRAFHVQPDIRQTLAEERRDPKIWVFPCRSWIPYEQTQKVLNDSTGLPVALPFEKPCHSACSRASGQKRLNCSLLRTCRSVYLEANHLTRYNNMFIFTDWVPLRRFPQAIGPVSTSFITKIQLDIVADCALEEHYWDLNIRLMAREMTNLEEVHIYIERPEFKSGLPRRVSRNRNFATPFLPGILDLTTLGLRSLTLDV